MNTPDNARSTASKHKINESFKMLLAEKEPAAITVKEICALAKVHRTTFYAHYSNMGELLEALEAEIVLKAGEEMLLKTADVSQFVAKDTILRMLHFVRENEALYQLYFLQSTESLLVSTLAEQVKTKFILPELDKSTVYAAAEYDYQYEFCKEGTLGIFKKWLMGGCKEADEVIAILLEKMLRRCLP